MAIQSKANGLNVRMEVMGDAFVQRAIGNTTALTELMQDVIDEWQQSHSKV